MSDNGYLCEGGDQCPHGADSTHWVEGPLEVVTQVASIRLVNLTPHAIVLQSADGSRVTVPPSGTVARVQSTPGEMRTVEGLPVPVASPTRYGMVEGVPGYPEPGCMYIVSGMVLAALLPWSGGWDHVVAPGTGPNDGAIRNDKGQIEAVTRLIGK